MVRTSCDDGSCWNKLPRDAGNGRSDGCSRENAPRGDSKSSGKHDEACDREVYLQHSMYVRRLEDLDVRSKWLQFWVFLGGKIGKWFRIGWLLS